MKIIIADKISERGIALLKETGWSIVLPAATALAAEIADADGLVVRSATKVNRELLEKLSTQTGGRYWRPQDLSKLPDEISYSQAGITLRETKDLWDMPIVFLLILLFRFSEWLLRRKWGVV